jgi:hypothetical protein
VDERFSELKPGRPEASAPKCLRVAESVPSGAEAQLQRERITYELKLVPFKAMQFSSL